jgi:hypothetical protein
MPGFRPGRRGEREALKYVAPQQSDIGAFFSVWQHPLGERAPNSFWRSFFPAERTIRLLSPPFLGRFFLLAARIPRLLFVRPFRPESRARRSSPQNFLAFSKRL